VTGRQILGAVGGVLLVAWLTAPAGAAETTTPSWILLVPPADYTVETHRYTRRPDAPLAVWYRNGEYPSERDCQAGRQAKWGEAKRMSETTADPDKYLKEQALAFQHGRCVSQEELSKHP